MDDNKLTKRRRLEGARENSSRDRREARASRQVRMWAGQHHPGSWQALG